VITVATRFFLDTNILVYTFDHADTEKRDRARGLVERALVAGDGVISYQVVQEFLNVAGRKFARPLKPADQIRYLESVLVPLCAIYPSDTFYRRGIDIAERYGYGFYDSLIIAGALAAGASRLYSEELQHGQRIEGATIVNPFVEWGTSSRT